RTLVCYEERLGRSCYDTFPSATLTKCVSESPVKSISIKARPQNTVAFRQLKYFISTHAPHGASAGQKYVRACSHARCASTSQEHNVPQAAKDLVCYRSSRVP